MPRALFFLLYILGATGSATARKTGFLERKEACVAAQVAAQVAAGYYVSETPKYSSPTATLTHIDLELFNELMTHTIQESFGYQLSDFKDRSDRWFSSLECRKLDFSSGTRLITRVEIQNSLSKCLCGTLRKRFTSSVANVFSCEIQSLDKHSVHDVLLDKMKRFNAFARFRLGLYSGMELLKQYDALFDKCVLQWLETEVSQNSKAPPSATPTDAKGNGGKEKPGTSDGVADINSPGSQGTPQPSSSQSSDEASPVFWALLFFVVVLILGLALVLLIHHSRRNPGAWLPLLGLDPDEPDHQQICPESTPSSNAQTGRAQGVFGTGRTVTTDPVGAAGATLADLVDHTLVLPSSSRGDSDIIPPSPSASVNHPD